MKRILECHVQGYTLENKKVPEYKRGKFLGLSDYEMLKHYRSMKVKYLQIMPIFDSEGTYWGYDPISWMEVNPKYGTLEEFKLMVEQLHQEGIQVILDVVYNHTARPFEGVSYYTGDMDNISGCGNTVNVKESLPVIMKSINYWLRTINVDGMRFDLANILCREGGGFTHKAQFLKEMEAFKDKILIAEPWDCWEVNYDYPEPWLVLNGYFRDHAKKGWGYSYHNINYNQAVDFITCHDGFTLADHVSYNEKHNQLNGENNRDGCNDNYSYNHGVEGHTDNLDIIAARKQHIEYLLSRFEHSHTILMFMGDELGNSQQGCNNAYKYCNPVTWPEKIEKLIGFGL